MGEACKRRDCHFVPQLDDCLARVFTILPFMSPEQKERDLWRDRRMGVGGSICEEKRSKTAAQLPPIRSLLPGGTEDGSHLCSQGPELGVDHR